MVMKHTIPEYAPAAVQHRKLTVAQIP